jgi:hypothetical protein
MIQFRDNTKARIHSKDYMNEYVVRKGRAIKAQDEIFKWILNSSSKSIEVAEESKPLKVHRKQVEA